MQRIHGLVIRGDVTLPGIAHTHASAPDVVLEVANQLPAPVTARLRYRAGTADDVGARVEIVDDARGHVAFRYGPVLGFVLRARGQLALHASCVRIDEGAVLIAGVAGAGKSTTAAALATRGYAVISDDLTALTLDDGVVTAWPAFDHLRLWPTSEPLVLDDAAPLERITPTWDKRRFPLDGAAFTDVPCPVRAIVVLRERQSDARVVARALTPAHAVIKLATLTYANYLLDAPMRAHELIQLGALVRAVPVVALTPPWGRDGLGSLCDAIVRVADARTAALA